MNESLHTKIEEARNEVEKIQAERDKIKKWAEGIQLPLYQQPPADRTELVEQYNKFHHLSSQLEVVQQVLSSLMLESLNESTNELNSSIQKLNESSNQQLSAALNLEESSRKLESLTGALLLLTGVLAVVGSSSYFLAAFKETGFNGSMALGWTFIATMTTVGLIFLGFVLLSRQARKRQAKSKSKTLISKS